MTYLLSFFLTLVLSAAAFAQTEPVRVAESPDENFARPSWSPDGRYIAFTSDQNRGIYVLDLASDEIHSVTDAEGAGFGFSWSADGGSILARVTRVDGVRRQHAVEVFDVETSESTRLTEFRDQMPALPVWSTDGTAVVLHHGEAPEVFVLEESPGAGVRESQALYVRDEQIHAADAHTGRALTLDIMPGERVLNLVRSRDGRRIAFEIMGGNMFAAIADGSGLVDLGPGHRPQFSPDGNRVAFMVTEDDGHEFTHSDLYVVNIDGSGHRNITGTRDRLEMNPTWSPDGSRIAFDAYEEGAIYVMTVDR